MPTPCPLCCAFPGGGTIFLRLLLESFRRQKRRKALAGAAILLGTTAVTAMLALATTIGDRIHKELAVYGANIVVTPKAANLAVNIGGLTLKPTTPDAYLQESDLVHLKNIFWHNNITALSPELTSPITTSIRNQFVETQVTGFWFNHPQSGVQQLNPSWKLTGSWPVSTPCPPPQEGPNIPCERGFQAVVGTTFASAHQLKIGDTIPLWNGIQLEAPAEARITGIVQTGDAHDTQILAPLEDMPEIAHTPTGALSRIEIAARTRPEDAFARKDPDTLSGKQKDIWYCRPYANSIAYQIREAIPNADAQQVRQVEQSEGVVLSRISGLMWLISAAALLAAAFAVSAAMATAVLERRQEIGLMRSLGAHKLSVAALFLSESALLALAAGTLGYIFGSLLAWKLGAHIFPSASAGPIFIPVLLPVIVGLAVIVAVAGSLPSIRSGLSASPSDVLRGNA